MLKGRVIPSVLKQLNTSGTIASVLLTSKGSILGCSQSAEASAINMEVVSGVVASIWQDFAKSRPSAGQQTEQQQQPAPSDGPELENIIISLERHNIVASEICGQFIVCCIASTDALLGMLKLKHALLCKAIAPTLAQIDVAP